MHKIAFIKKHIIPIILFIATLTVYLLTLSPTVNFGDSGEFISVAYTLGIAHPPGYPLWTLIARLFAILPLGVSVAAKVNFASAVFAALAVVVVYLIIKKIMPVSEPTELVTTLLRGNARESNTATRELAPLLSREITAISASLFMAFTLVFWRYAVVTEVYSLNLLIFALITYFFIQFYENQNIKFLYLFFYLSGLGFTIHPTMIFIFPVFLVFIIIIAYKPGFTGLLDMIRSKENLCVVFFLLGLTPYLYLFIRSFAKPDLDWGGLTNFKDFTGHIFRARYPSAPLFRPFDLFSAQLLLNIKEIVTQFLFLPVIIAIYGLWEFSRKQKLLSIFFASVIFLFIFAITFFNNAPISMWFDSEMRVFLLPVFIFITILLGYGMESISSKISVGHHFVQSLKKVHFRSANFSLPFLDFKHSQTKVCTPPLTETMTIDSKIPFNNKINYVNLIWLIFPLILLFINYEKCDKSRDDLAEKYAKNIITDLEKNAVILTVSDFQSFPLLYVNKIENYRSDITLIQSINIRSANSQLPPHKPIVMKSLDQMEFIPDLSRDDPPYYMELNELTASVAPYLKLKNIAYKIYPTPLDSISGQDVASILYFYQNYLNTFLDKPYFKFDPVNQMAFAHCLNQISFYFDIKKRPDISNQILLMTKNISPYFSGTSYNLAISYFSLGKEKEAEETLIKLIDIDPYNSDAQYRLGLYYEHMGETEKAIEHHEKAQIFAMDKIFMRNHLAEIYFNKGDYKKAEKIYRKIQKQDFFDPEVNEKLGLIYFEQKRYDMALHHFKIANKNGIRLLSTMKIGDIRMLLGYYEEAEKDYLDVLKINPNNLRALTKLAWIYNTLGKDQEENQIFDKALQIPTTDYQTWITIACYYSDQNKIKCHKALTRAIEIGGEPVKPILKQEECLKDLWKDKKFMVLINQ